MAKKEKINKITKEELETIQEFVNNLNQVQLQIGGLEAQKYDFLAQMGLIRQELQKTQNELQEKYGEVTINLTDGTISDASDS